MMTDLPDIATGLAVLVSTGLCPVVPAPEISVETARQETEIRRELSKEDLKALRNDTDLPYQLQDLSHVETGGMMRGNIGIKYDIAFDEVPGNTAETVNQSCVRYRAIRVTLEIDPTIFIASDYEDDSCWYHEVRQHEESHIDMDQLVVEKYAGRIQEGLKLAFSLPEDSIDGPATGKGVAALKKDMGNNVIAMVNVLATDMARERHEKQQGVDSLGGYGYIMNTCYSGDNVFTPEP